MSVCLRQLYNLLIHCILMKVLVTGASGFIGSFLVERGLEMGYDMWAGMRKGSSRLLA